MNRITPCIVFALCLSTSLSGQSKPDSSALPPSEWKHSPLTGLNVTQVSFSDWSQGGENALAYAASVVGKSVYEPASIVWSSSYKLGFGQTQLGDRGMRKTEDKIELETVLTYKFGAYVNPYAAATLKTQFALGFKYDNLGNATALSKFFDPAFLTQSIGAGYQFIPQIKTRLGYALREIYTDEFYSYADDAKTPQPERVKVEDGFESVTDIQWQLDQSILFISKIELFLNVGTGDKLVLRSDNTVTIRAAKFITVSLNVNVINERQVSPRTQLKNTLGIGLSYAVL